MKIVIIGTGNVATILGRKLVEAQHEIMQIWGRNVDTATKLATTLHAQPVDSFQNITPDADIYLIAVSDGAIASVAAELTHLQSGIIAHTAGSVPLSVLENAGMPSGILYPLQSLRKSMKNIPHIPLLVDGSTESARAVMLQLAQSISDNVEVADDATRLKLHLAAVISSNFANHLYSLAYAYCKKEHLSFDLLLPLIYETANRLGDFDPASLQTGPAVREDNATVKKHLKMLEDAPEIAKLYEDLSASIVAFKRSTL